MQFEAGLPAAVSGCWLGSEMHRKYVRKDPERLTELTGGATTLICHICREYFPLSDFTRTRLGGYGEVCSECRPALQGAKHEARRRQVLTALVKQYSQGIKSDKIEVPHTSELAEAISRKIGGSDAFADLFVENMQQACASEPGGKTALGYMRTFTELIVRSTDQRETAPDVNVLTEDELEGELRHYVAKMIEANPDLGQEVIEANVRRLSNEAKVLPADEVAEEVVNDNELADLELQDDLKETE